MIYCYYPLGEKLLYIENYDNQRYYMDKIFFFSVHNQLLI